MKPSANLLLTAALLLAAGCSAVHTEPAPEVAGTRVLATVAATDNAATTHPFPTIETNVPFVTPAATDEAWDWTVSNPEEQGLDSQLLAQMVETIHAEGLNVHSVLVVRRGVLVQEAYFGAYDVNRKHEQFSVTKSVMSALIGIAIEQGQIESVQQLLSDFFPAEKFAGLDPQVSQLTLEDVLTMRSGLAWVESDADLGDLWPSGDWTEYMLSLPLQAPPGEEFNYCSGCSHLLSAVLYEATGTDPQAYARQYLFEPLGITDVLWQTNPHGETIGGWGLYLRSRDMARLGLLYLNGGEWAGRTVVPLDWVEASVSKQVETGGGLDYGYQWWVDTEAGTFAALGHGGQVIYVHPALELVVVFTAGQESNDSLLELIEQYVVPAVKENYG